MSPREKPCLLFVHAHPDDESLTTGGTIAHYVAQGADVHVVTCTLGEEGDVLDDRYALLMVDHGDQLGGFRINELSAALKFLGVAEPIFLGGAGRWRDSGMPPKVRPPHTAFVDAGDDATQELVDIIDKLRPHVVVTYDPVGGYGHPDHIQTHGVTEAAIAASEWKVSKFYWTVLAASALQSGLDTWDEVPPNWVGLPRLSEMGFGYPDSDIDAVIDSRDCLEAKLAALAAHATQLALAPDRRSVLVSNNFVQPILTKEHYVLAAGVPGPRNSQGWETDLLAGLNLQ